MSFMRLLPICAQYWQLFKKSFTTLYNVVWMKELFNISLSRVAVLVLIFRILSF